MAGTMMADGFFLTQNGLRTEGSLTVGMDELQELVAGVTQKSTQSTLLMKKKKEMREVNDALEFMKQEYRSRMDLCDKRQREFEAKQLEMKEQVLKFEKFIQENDAKRARADTKAKQERRVLEQKDAELRRLAAELDAAMAEEAKLKEQREKLKGFQGFLTRTIDASEQEFDEIGDLLSRYCKALNRLLCSGHMAAYYRFNTYTSRTLNSVCSCMQCMHACIWLFLNTNSYQHEFITLHLHANLSW
jgi:chromosome segregation ATPase